MPVHGGEVTVGECLEVKGSRLTERELWSVLREALEAAYDAFYQDHIDPTGLLPITPDSLVLLPNGTLHIAPVHRFSAYYEECMPPEFLEKVTFSIPQLEKILIYSLGMSVYSAADYKLSLNESLDISVELDSLLTNMCHRQAHSRTSLQHALVACRNNTQAISCLIDLHRMVLGNHHLYNSYRSDYPPNSSQYRARSSVYSSMASRFTNEPSTLHYVILDPDKRNSASSKKSRRHDSKNSINDNSSNTNYNLTLPSMRSSVLENIDGEASVEKIEEAYGRLNERRRRLHGWSGQSDVMRTGSMGNLKRETDDEDTGYNTMKTHGNEYDKLKNVLAKSTPDLHDALNDGVSQQDYEWLEEKSREIELWRKKYLRDNEIIIMPEPATRMREEQVATMAPDTSLDSVLFQDVKGEKVGRDGWVAMKDESVQVLSENLETNTTDETENRSFVGPEFKQTHVMSNLIVREASIISESNLRNVKVKLLNGAEVDIACCADNTTQQLFDCLAAYLMLQEQNYFGLAVFQDNEMIFLKNSAKLSKRAPANWSAKKKFRGSQGAVFIIYMCVQYYMPDIANLRSQATRHQFYLQLRQSLLNGGLQITDHQTNLELAALALQAEYGPNYNNLFSEFIYEDYLPSRVVEKMGKESATKILRINYSKYSSVSQVDAEISFIKMCMRQLEYGYHFYRIAKDKKLSNAESRWVGIGMKGVVLGEESEEYRYLTKAHPWNDVSKVSYNRHRFSITSAASNIKSNYFTNSYRKCDYLLWIVADQNVFQRSYLQLSAINGKPAVVYDVKSVSNRISGKINGSKQFLPSANQIGNKVYTGNNVGYRNKQGFQQNERTLSYENIDKNDTTTYPNNINNSNYTTNNFNQNNLKYNNTIPNTLNYNSITNPKTLNYNNINPNTSNYNNQTTKTNDNNFNTLSKTSNNIQTPYQPMPSQADLSHQKYLTINPNDQNTHAQLNDPQINLTTQNLIDDNFNKSITLPRFNIIDNGASINPNSQNQPTNQPLKISSSQVVNQPASQPVTKPNLRPVTRPISQPPNQPPNKLSTSQPSLNQESEVGNETFSRKTNKSPRSRNTKYNEETTQPHQSSIFQPSKPIQHPPYHLHKHLQGNSRNTNYSSNPSLNPLLEENEGNPEDNTDFLDDSKKFEILKSPLLDKKSLIPSIIQNELDPIPTYSTPKPAAQPTQNPQATQPEQQTQSIKNTPLPDKIENENQNIHSNSVSDTKVAHNFKKVGVKVNLVRSPPQGFGIGLARDRSQEGVFVVSILPTGVAAQDGRLKAGDQIMGVNGESVSGMEGYNRTVELLSNNKEASIEVERVIVVNADTPVPASNNTERDINSNNNNANVIDNGYDEDSYNITENNSINNSNNNNNYNINNNNNNSFDSNVSIDDTSSAGKRNLKLSIFNQSSSNSFVPKPSRRKSIDIDLPNAVHGNYQRNHRGDKVNTSDADPQQNERNHTEDNKDNNIIDREPKTSSKISEISGKSLNMNKVASRTSSNLSSLNAYPYSYSNGTHTFKTFKGVKEFSESNKDISIKSGNETNIDHYSRSDEREEEEDEFMEDNNENIPFDKKKTKHILRMSHPVKSYNRNGEVANAVVFNDNFDDDDEYEKRKINYFRDDSNNDDSNNDDTNINDANTLNKYKELVSENSELAENKDDKIKSSYKMMMDDESGKDLPKQKEGVMNGDVLVDGDLVFFNDDESDDGLVVIDRCREIADLPEIITEQYVDDILLRDCRRAFDDKKVSSSVEDADEGDMARLLSEMEDMLEGAHVIMEFKNLKQTSRLQGTCNVGRQPGNKHKNRYQNVLPYDKSRVRLQSSSDYINASHIEYHIKKSDASISATDPSITNLSSNLSFSSMKPLKLNKNKKEESQNSCFRFIAAQAPLKNTVGDFWQMVWQEGVKVVVMLTQLVEAHRHKSAQYWPQRVLVVKQLYHIKQLECLESRDFELKFFQMTNLSSGESRLVSHLTYLTWSELDHQGSVLPLLKFVSFVDCLRCTSDHHQPPILLHCSAGIGRCAVFLTIYLALKTLAHGYKFDIATIIKTLRSQRPGMLQNEHQYALTSRALVTALRLIKQYQY